MYKRKTKNVFIIRGRHLGMPKEDIDTAIRSKRLGI